MWVVEVQPFYFVEWLTGMSPGRNVLIGVPSGIALEQRCHMGWWPVARLGLLAVAAVINRSTEQRILIPL